MFPNRAPVSIYQSYLFFLNFEFDFRYLRVLVHLISYQFQKHVIESKKNFHTFNNKLISTNFVNIYNFLRMSVFMLKEKKLFKSVVKCKDYA